MIHRGRRNQLNYRHLNALMFHEYLYIPIFSKFCGQQKKTMLEKNEFKAKCNLCHEYLHFAELRNALHFYLFKAASVYISIASFTLVPEISKDKYPNCLPFSVLLKVTLNKKRFAGLWYEKQTNQQTNTRQNIQAIF